MNKNKKVSTLNNPVKNHIGYLISVIFGVVPLLLKYLTKIPDNDPKMMIILTIMFLISSTIIIITILILNFIYHFKQLKVIEKLSLEQINKIVENK